MSPRITLTPNDDGGYELNVIPDEPKPEPPGGFRPLAKAAAAVVVLALVALYGCGGHGSSATTPPPTPTVSAKR